MTPRLIARRLILLVALAGAAWLAVFGDKTPPGVVQPPATARSSSTGAARSATQAPAGRASSGQSVAPLSSIEALVDRASWHETASTRGVDLFAPAPWMSAAPAPLAVAAAPDAPPPPPPPPSWRVVGKQWVEGQWEVFLMKDAQTQVARQGAVLEGAWRIDRIEPPVMTFTHVPSLRQHQISIGEAT